jgi:hypothetical protein
MPRTVFTGTQFRCPYCGWQSSYEQYFIEKYKTLQNEPEPLWWAEEFKVAGNREGIADRLRFHGTLFVDGVVKRSGLSPQTVRKHLNSLVDDGRALRSTHLVDAYHHVPEDHDE